MLTPRRLLVPAALVLVALGGLTGCGGSEEHVSLAVTPLGWNSETDIVFTTECADITEATFEPGAGGEPGTVTVWGDPKMGTCEPQLVIPVPAGTTKVVDAASSEVVDLPPHDDE